MPTNDERREVAARLRDKAGRVCFDGCEVEECLSSGDWRYSYSAGDGARSYMRLADLIEPEERTCRIRLVNVTDSLGQKMYRCSECGALMTDDACFFDGVDEIGWFSYCPNCGAKVVDEDA